MIGCDMLTHEAGIYRGHGEILTPPQSSPESHHSHLNLTTRGIHSFDSSGSEIILPKNIPDILLCKFIII